LGNQTV